MQLQSTKDDLLFEDCGSENENSDYSTGNESEDEKM